MKLVKRAYANIQESKNMYSKIAVLMEFIVIVFVVFTQYNYWLTRPTNEMEYAQNAEYNLELTVKDLKEGQYEKIVETTKFDGVEDSSIVKETGFDIKHKVSLCVYTGRRCKEAGGGENGWRKWKC